MLSTGTGPFVSIFFLIINLHVIGDKPSRQHAETNVINLIDKHKTYDKRRNKAYDHM